MNTFRVTKSLLLAGMIFSSPLIFAAEDGKFGFSLGAFFSDMDTRTRIDSKSDLIGFETSMEDDLGLDSSENVFRFDGYYRFNDRHRMDASVFSFSRSGASTITTDLQWGDRFFTFDTNLDTTFDLDVYKASYTYSFLVRDKGYLGVSAGLYVADINLEVTNLDDQSESESSDVTAPLPVIGLRGEYRINDKWSLRGSSEFFFIDIDEIKGALFDLYVGIDYQIFENVALGAGVNSVKIDVDADGSHIVGALDWKYDGALVYLKFDF